LHEEQCESEADKDGFHPNGKPEHLRARKHNVQVTKRVKYLSPTALDTWLKNPEEFFVKYCVVEKPPRFPQTLPMSVGSAFDAYIKSYLHQKLFGKQHKDSNQFHFDTLFEKQVEAQNRDFALQAGAVCFDAYKNNGAIAKLLPLLERSVSEPRFEFTASNTDENGNITSAVTPPDGMVEDDPVVLLGKPDLAFEIPSQKITYDWKVNGYCGNSAKSPTPGYIVLLDPGHKNHQGMHKDAVPGESDGLLYNLIPNIQVQEITWARQLAVYSWLSGAPVGSDIIVGIDQLCCSPAGPVPKIKVALHRSPLMKEFQVATYKQFQDLWNRCNVTGHVLHNLSVEDAEVRQAALASQGAAYTGGDENTSWLNSIRGNR